jgi:DNA-binding PadR family transcriptional regulator
MSVHNALLGLLLQRPRHGYELRAAFEALVGGQQNWEVKPAQIYTTLSRLEESALVVQHGVAQEGGPEKHIYAITPEGCTELTTWLTTGVEGEHQRDELFVKLMVSLTLGSAIPEATPQRVIQAQRARLYQELHSFTVRRNTADPRSELALIFLLDKAVMHLEADLRWLELLEARLDDIRSQPLPEPEVRPRGRPKKLSSE